MEKTQKNTHGGARAGAGRKAKPHGKSITFRSSVEVEAFLSAFHGNKAEFINEAIINFAKTNNLL